MSRFSLLPPYLTILETWIIRLFLFLALITIGPWILFILADMLLYTIRAILYEIPFFGGRARGKRRPRRPTSSESRKRGRAWSFGGSGVPEGLRRHGSWQSEVVGVGVVVEDEGVGEEEVEVVVRRRKRRGDAEGDDGREEGGVDEGGEGSKVDEGVQAGEADVRVRDGEDKCSHG